METFREKLKAGKHLIGFEVDLCDACISEMVGMLGYDYIWIDTEHEAMDYQTVLMQIIACKAAGSASVVRIPFNEPYLAKRILEMGPDGIIFPMVNSAKEAQAAIDACLYPPLGKRGFGPRRACRYGAEDLFDYIREAPERTCRFIQLEHVDAIRDLDSMLKKSGVDTVILAGTTTPNCVRTTCYDSIAYDYRTLVLARCTSSQTDEIQHANLEDMRRAGAEII